MNRLILAVMLALPLCAQWAQTTLLSPVTVSGTSLTVRSSADMSIATTTVLYLGSERMLVTNIVGAIVTVTRGYQSTTATAHDAGSTVLIWRADLAATSPTTGGMPIVWLPDPGANGLLVRDALGSTSTVTISGTSPQCLHMTSAGVVSGTGADCVGPLGYTAENAANKGVASGYASLDTGVKVPIAQLPTGTSSTTLALGDHSQSLSKGGTGADLSATGGSGQVVQQASTGAALTVGQLAAANLSNGTTGSGSVVLASSPTLTTPTVAGSLVLSELTANGSNKRVLQVPDALTADLTMKLPDATPSNSVLVWPSPTAGVS